MSTIEILQKQVAEQSAKLAKLQAEIKATEEAAKVQKAKEVSAMKKTAPELIKHINTLIEKEVTETELLTLVRAWCLEKLPVQAPVAKGSKVGGNKTAGTTTPRTGVCADIHKKFAEICETPMKPAQVFEKLGDYNIATVKTQFALAVRDGELIKNADGLYIAVK